MGRALMRFWWRLEDVPCHYVAALVIDARMTLAAAGTVLGLPPVAIYDLLRLHWHSRCLA